MLGVVWYAMGLGGGASENGYPSGKGGDGCDGWAVIIVYS